MLVKKLVCLFLLMVSALSINAQDLMASASTNDVSMKKADTITLKIIKERESNELVSPLYKDWKNCRVRCEGDMPEVFDIDLRDFTMPTPSKVITSNYGPRHGRNHNGVDVKVYIGDTIYAAFSGKVRIVNYEAQGYGNYVVIRHSNGLETVYGHLSKHLVKPNQIVKSGDPIGLGGNTGRSTGSHLHFETRLCGIALNPSLMFDFKMQDVTGDYYHFVKKNMVVIKVNPTPTKKKK